MPSKYKKIIIYNQTLIKCKARTETFIDMQNSKKIFVLHPFPRTVRKCAPTNQVLKPHLTLKTKTGNTRSRRFNTEEAKGILGIVRRMMMKKDS